MRRRHVVGVCVFPMTHPACSPPNVDVCRSPNDCRVGVLNAPSGSQCRVCAFPITSSVSASQCLTSLVIRGSLSPHAVDIANAVICRGTSMNSRAPAAPLCSCSPAPLCLSLAATPRVDGQTPSPAAPAAPRPCVRPARRPARRLRARAARAAAPRPIRLTTGDRTGWTQIFDGKTLTNWDGNPEVWKVEDGAIIAESWPERRVGGTLHHLARRRARRTSS